MSKEDELVIVDVGCRWGFADNFIDNLDNFRIYGFDPDKAECDRLNKYYSSDRVTIFPIALGESKRKTNLYLTEEAACSSIFKPRIDLIQQNPTLKCINIKKIVNVDLMTLDMWSRKYSVFRVDHIKLDTQGSEFLILMGSKNVLKNVRTIQVEVEFNAIYEEQHLFSDVDALLRSQGFSLWKLTDLSHYGSSSEVEMHLESDSVFNNYNAQKVERFGGQLFWGEAHYICNEIIEASYGECDQLERDIKLLQNLGYLDLVDRLKRSVL
jgi:FkbM family methyltransferase